MEIPDWTKNIFLWYGEDKVSNDELINALKFDSKCEVEFGSDDELKNIMKGMIH